MRFPRTCRAVASALGVTVLALATAIGGLGGAAYLALWVAAAATGLPAGFLLFGRRHPAGWLAGALLGHVATALTLWLAIEVGATSSVAMVGFCLVTAAAFWLGVPRTREPLVALPSFGSADLLALLVFLWLVPLLAGPAFLRVGSTDAKGNQLYRAYFTADFLWHEALTVEVSRFVLPPVNPYLAAEPLHYYWTYFLLPAAVVGHLEHPGASVEHILLVHAFCAGLVFFGMVFVGVWCAVPRAAAALTAATLAALAASAEGAFTLWDLWRRSRPFSGVLELNIDAVSYWRYQGIRIDGLPRSLWYVPQHAMSVALGLVAMITLGANGMDASLLEILLAGTALGGAVLVSPIMGAAFSAAYGVGVLLDGLRTPRALPRALVRHGLAAVPVLLALGWVVANRVLEGTGGALTIGLGGLSHERPVASLALELGPLVVAAIAGAAFGGWRRSQIPAVAIVLVAAFALYLVYVPKDLAYVGFRAGQMLLVSLPMLAAGFFARGTERRWRPAVFALALACFLVGVPTTAIDAYNAQDVTNRLEGPGFKWTMVVTPEEQRGLQWIRLFTPEHAVVQMDPLVRVRDRWTFIPSLAHRRMAGGLPISLLQEPAFRAATDRVHGVYWTTSALDACEAARDLGIEYIYIDGMERAGIPAASLNKFDRYPACFHREFRNSEVDIFAVRPRSTVLRR
jgi:hypothetical protein